MNNGPNEYSYSYSIPMNLSPLVQLGTMHYSWAFAFEKFKRMLASFGHYGMFLKQPQLYDHPICQELEFSWAKKPLHLIFRPFNQIRPLKFGHNIGCVVWEFNKFPCPNDHNHPFENYFEMLSMLDEIWTASRCSKKVFESEGLKNVYHIPAPIYIDEPEVSKKQTSLHFLKNKLSVFLDISHWRAAHRSHSINRAQIVPLFMQNCLKHLDEKIVYISVLNPGDDRKNIWSILNAFIEFSNVHNDCVCIIKLAIDNNKTRLDNVQNDTIKLKLLEGCSAKSKNIIFISDYLSECEMRELYLLADFYLCTSRCEGQNLPLLEAMGHGVIPISVDHTAMADYINDQNSVVISSKSMPVELENACENFDKELLWYYASVQDVIDALNRSASLSSEEKKLMRTNAVSAVSSDYGYSSIYAKIARVFDNA